MAAPLNPSLFVPIGFGALLLWRTYGRIRRMVGRQHLSKVRPWITVAVFPVILALLVTTSLAKPTSLLALAGGAAIGVGLGIYGLRVTRYENTPQGMFYTPSAHVGIALSLLFVGRILYRLVTMYGPSGGPPAGPQIAYATTPLTLLIFGTLAGYYVTYAVGLLRWRHECSKATGAGNIGS
jgi:hypothetical protein